MIVVHQDDDIGIDISQPPTCGLVTVEERLPVRLLCLAHVYGDADRGHMRSREPGDDSGH